MRFTDMAALEHASITAAPALAPVRFAPDLAARFSVPVAVQVHPNLPLAGSQAGNVFRDCTDAGRAWYLPAFGLLAGVDPAFAFAATRTGVDSAGNPFERVTLSLTLVKSMPADATAFAAANPSLRLMEIPLDALAVSLMTSALDPQTGAARTSTYGGTLAAAGAGYHAVFDTLLGAAAIVAYENLQSGGATVTIVASYDTWRAVAVRPMPPRPLPPHPLPLPPHPIGPPRLMETPIRFVDASPAAELPPPVNGISVPAVFSAAIPLATAFAGASYALAYTIADSAGTAHPIVSVGDLTNFNARQSEFRPYTALGDIAQKYPSLSGLYIGVLSRRIVAVPARYGILRGSAGTAATCRAVLDSTAGSANACSFEFAFVLGALIDPIELYALTQAVAADSTGRDCTLTLPEQLDPGVAPTLSTGYASAVNCVPGAQPQTFALTVRVSDAAGGAPAVADANLFIAALTAGVQPYLTGQIGVKLDDFYAEPVTAGVVLNFSATSGSDEIRLAVDAASGDVQLANVSPLDLALSRYAVASAGSAAVTAFASRLPAGASATIPVASAAATVLVDRSLALESPLTKTAIARYLAFDINDVQDVAYDIGVAAGALDFAARKIARIDIAVTLSGLPAVAIPRISLSALDTAGNAQIALPVQDALTALAATVALTVVCSDSSVAPIAFTLANDFIANPVLVLMDSAVPAFPTSPA